MFVPTANTPIIVSHKKSPYLLLQNRKRYLIQSRMQACIPFYEPEIHKINLSILLPTS